HMALSAKKTVSCIIPAYNEAKSIENTLRVVTSIPEYITEVLVVDDGSSDNTQNIVKSFPNVRLLVNEMNQGKSKTIARGIRESSGDYFLMLDADLIGLDAQNIIDLIRPIADGSADVTISIRANTPDWMKKVGVDFMSGERMLPRQVIMQYIDAMSELRGFGLEVFLNRILIKHKLRIRSVIMDNVLNDMKWKKRGFWKGLRAEAFLWYQLFRTVSPVEFVGQNVRMRKLLVK
ncbi:MAG: glycosyl transferase, partial [Candidatus Taylorbacteria bacterium]|nr:glycosyl transferase [Candidatus Taylorbacteria bacterium]